MMKWRVSDNVSRSNQLLRTNAKERGCRALISTSVRHIDLGRSCDRLRSVVGAAVHSQTCNAHGGVFDYIEPFYNPKRRLRSNDGLSRLS